MPFLLPLRLRKQMAYNRRQSQAERESLLDSILPSPTHPRAKPRALATCSLAIFLLLVVWMAATNVSQSENEEKKIWQPSMQRWVWESGVEMGNNDDVSLQGQETQMLGQEIQEIVDNDGENGSDGDDIDLEDEEAEATMKSGLAKYIWHQDLEWDADGSGRLIVVGDVHGMLDQLK